MSKESISNDTKPKTEKNTMIESIVDTVNNLRPKDKKMSEYEKKELTKILEKFPEDNLNMHKKRNGFSEIIVDINNEMKKPTPDFKEIDNVLRKYSDSTKDNAIKDIVEAAIVVRKKKLEEDKRKIPTEEEKLIKEKLTKTLEKLPTEVFDDLKKYMDISKEINEKMQDPKLDFKKIDKILVKEFGEDQVKTQTQASTKQKIKVQVKRMKTGLQNAASAVSQKASKAFSKPNLRKRTDKSNSR